MVCITIAKIFKFSYRTCHFSCEVILGFFHWTVSQLQFKVLRCDEEVEWYNPIENRHWFFKTIIFSLPHIGKI